MATKIDLPRSVQVGDTADVSLIHTHTVLRSIGLNPDVVMDFTVDKNCTICGIEHALNLLREVLPENSSEVWGITDGTQVEAGQIVLRIQAPYSSLVNYQSAICGFLASLSGWATAAYECTQASGNKKVIAACAYSSHPTIVADIEYAAVKGGCVGVSTPLASRVTGVSTISTPSVPLVLIVGSLSEVLQQFDQIIPVEVTRTARLGVLKDETEDALAAIKAMDKIGRFLVSPHPQRGRATVGLVKEIHAHLGNAGKSDVDIMVGGGFTPAIIKEFVEQDAPVAVFIVGNYIASAPPVGVSSEITEIDGAKVTRRGVIPQSADDAELERIL